MLTRRLPLFAAALAIASVASRSAAAQPADPGDDDAPRAWTRPEVAIETSPVAPVLRGAALAGRVRFPDAPHAAFGAGIYAITLPQFFVNQEPDNQWEGWRVSIRPAAYVCADWFLRPNGTGFSLGAGLGVARFAISNEMYAGSTAYTALSAVPRGAYTWLLTDSLYVTGQLSVEIYAKIAGSAQLASRPFTPPTLQPMLGVQLGYIVMR